MPVTHLHCDVGANEVGEGSSRSLLRARAAAGSCACSPPCGAAVRAHDADKQGHRLVGHGAEDVAQGVADLQVGGGGKSRWHMAFDRSKSSRGIAASLSV